MKRISFNAKKHSIASILFSTLVAMFVCMLLYACATPATGKFASKAGSNVQPVINTPDSADIIKPIAEKYADRMLKAINNNDYKMFVTFMTKPSQAKYSPRKFHKMVSAIKEAFGKYKSRQFLTVLRRGVSREIIWKGEFDKAAKKGRDVLIRLLIAKLDDKYRVFGFGIQ